MLDAGLLEQERVEHDLDPAPVARALASAGVLAPSAQRLCSAALLDGNEASYFVDQRLAEVVVDGVPDLAVGVHLRARSGRSRCRCS